MITNPVGDEARATIMTPGAIAISMKRYLLFVCHTYSFEILRPLQAEIRRRGDDVAWFFNEVDPSFLAAGERLLTTVDEVRRYDPRAIYVPGNWVPDFFPGAKVQLFHGLANDRTGKPGHYHVRGFFDLYCTHSPETTAGYLKQAKRYKSFHVLETGWPKLDPLFHEGEVNSIRDELGTTKPIVLYASTFSPSLTSAPFLFDAIETLSRQGDWFWLVTLHPKTRPEVFRRYRAMEGPNLRFADSGLGVLQLLETADVMVCDTSSISLEFMLLDKPVVTFRTRVPGPWVIDVRRPEEVGPAIGRALERPEELMRETRKYMDELHPYRDGLSSGRVLDATEEFIEHYAAGLGPKPLNLWRKMQMRSWMRYYHLR